MARQVIRSAFALLLLTAILVVPALPAEAARTIALTTPSSPAGTLLTFKGTGWDNEETISWWFTMPDGMVMPGKENDPAKVSKTGELTIEFHMPSHALTGTWAISVYGFSLQTEAIGYFQVTPAETGKSANLANAVPAAGPAGTGFVFQGSGFGADDKIVRWTTNLSTGAVQNVPDWVKADGGGVVQFTFASPTDLRSGRYAMTAYGIDSDRTAIAYFEVTP